jgi:hypothetical protein
MTPVDLVPYDESTAVAPVLFLVGVLGVGLGALLAAVVARYFAFRRAERNELAWLREKSEVPLSPGARRVVRGRVDVDGDDDVAVRVDIEQTVKNFTNKGNRWHTWTEIGRRVEARPFYLESPGGEPVYVEPDVRAFVVDDIESTYPIDRPLRRIRVADVRRGETYYAYGDLARGPHPRARSAYRDGTGWILRVPRGDRMILATSVLRDRYGARARFLLVTALLAIPVFVAFHAFATYPYLATLFAGEVTSARVDRAWTYDTTNKGRTTTNYAMSIIVPGAPPETHRISLETYRWIQRARAEGGPVAIPVVQAPRWTSVVYLGDAPYVSTFVIVFASIFAGALGLTAFVLYSKVGPWYDRRRLNEHGGDGHWIEPRPGAPVDALKHP